MIDKNEVRNDENDSKSEKELEAELGSATDLSALLQRLKAKNESNHNSPEEEPERDKNDPIELMKEMYQNIFAETGESERRKELSKKLDSATSKVTDVNLKSKLEEFSQAYNVWELNQRYKGILNQKVDNTDTLIKADKLYHEIDGYDKQNEADSKKT